MIGYASSAAAPCLDRLADQFRQDRAPPNAAAGHDLDAVQVDAGRLLHGQGIESGIEIALELDELRSQGKLMRNGKGQYELGQAEPRSTGLTEDAKHHISLDPNAKLQALSRTK